jgi:hypothetical protein
MIQMPKSEVAPPSGERLATLDAAAAYLAAGGAGRGPPPPEHHPVTPATAEAPRQ